MVSKILSTIYLSTNEAINRNVTASKVLLDFGLVFYTEKKVSATLSLIDGNCATRLAIHEAAH